MKVLLLFVLFSLVVLNRVEAEQNSDEDPDLLFWKTVNDGPGSVSVYENVDLKENSFYAVCLGYQFSRKIAVDGQIYLETSSKSRVFEWKSHFNWDDTLSYSRLQCYGEASTCYSTEESKCNEEGAIEKLPFGHCQEDMSMIISSESFAISCGEQVVEAKRCSDGGDMGSFEFDIAVKELRNGVCATRIRPNNSGWIDVLSGESTVRSIDLKSQSLLINQLMIRERHSDTTLFTVNFHAVASVQDDSAVVVIILESSGTYIYKTSVTLTASVCSTGTASKKYFVGGELGKTQIQMTLVGDQIAIMVSDGSDREAMQEDTIWLTWSSCSEVGEELMMSFEDATAKRNTYLMGNTNIRIVDKGECLEPDVKPYGLKTFGEDQTEQRFQIGSEVRLECENPMYEIEGSNIITCQLDNTWTPVEFPVCVRKTCEALKYLDGDGTCKDCFEFAERCEICDTSNVDDTRPESEIYLGEDGICQKCKNFVNNDRAFLDYPQISHDGEKAVEQNVEMSITCSVQGFPRPSATLTYENLADGERSQIAGAFLIENIGPTSTKFHFLIHSSCDYSQYKFTCEAVTTNQTDCRILKESSSIEGPVVTGCQYADVSKTGDFTASGVTVALIVMIIVGEI